MDNDMMFFIREGAKEMTIVEMTAFLNKNGWPELNYNTMYAISRRRHIDFKRGTKGHKRKNCPFPVGKKQLGMPPLKHIPQDPPPPPPRMVRPPAEYSNTTPYGIASKERRL